MGNRNLSSCEQCNCMYLGKGQYFSFWKKILVADILLETMKKWKSASDPPAPLNANAIVSLLFTVFCNRHEVFSGCVKHQPNFYINKSSRKTLIYSQAGYNLLIRSLSKLIPLKTDPSQNWSLSKLTLHKSWGGKSQTPGIPKIFLNFKTYL